MKTMKNNEKKWLGSEENKKKEKLERSREIKSEKEKLPMDSCK